MTLFLFVKQFVDMLFRYRFLDVFMLIFAVLLLAYQIGLVRPDFRKWFTAADALVFVLGGLITVNYLRTWSGWLDYFKVISALLIYFMGRMYYERIKECTGALVFSAYLIVYINLCVRIVRNGTNFLKITNADGDLYYYDTDMAFAMTLAMVFIAMFGRNSILKIVTILAVCPYMVFCSDAGIQKVLMLAVYMIILIYIVELVLRKQKLSDLLLSAAVIGLIGIVILIYLPVMGVEQAEVLLKLFGGRFLNIENMYTRYAEWSRVLGDFAGTGFGSLFFGLGMNAEISIQSLYIEIFYSTGLIGIMLSAAMILCFVRYVSKVKDRKNFYLAVIMVVLLLGTGVTVNSMESVQMSWFPFLFAGMVVSSVEAEESDISGV